MTDPLPRDVSDVAQPSRRTALVLGGGGSTGNAWLIGVLAGLREAGLRVTDADLIVGTSAGATAAAQVVGADLGELFAATLVPVSPRSGAGGSGTGRGPIRSVSDHLERSSRIIAASVDAADMRRRFGVAALEAADGSERWRATVAARLPQQNWPAQELLITAVDARTGEPLVFDRSSGVGLADAVAASCSSGFAYSIGENRYIDGGYRSNAENADLAAGYARVLVLSPFGGRTLTPTEWGLELATQVAELRAQGSGVETIVPDGDAEGFFGVNAMDLSLRPAAARAGFAQGRAAAGGLAEFWSGLPEPR